MLIDVETDKVETPSLGDKCSKSHASDDSYFAEVSGTRGMSQPVPLL
jgi:hypothetical protein